MLPRLRLLQVGDIHLPSAADAKAFVDMKDEKFPVNLGTLISRQPIKSVFLRIYEVLRTTNIDAILFMGDFTDLGNLVGYEACANYIKSSLQIGAKGLHAAVQVGIVPGNHDIDRQLAIGSSLTSKFVPLNSALNKLGLPALPVDVPRQISIDKTGASLKVYLLNSCWGCGEKEYIPEIFRTPISDAIDAALKGADAQKARKLYYDRQLDTPALSGDTITVLINAIHAASKATLPVVVGHHNLLPQRIARLAPYTELVNSGSLRASLGELKRPILFLHGHIHDDPIEILQQPSEAPLVIISAPEAVSGFNIVEVIYARTSVPLVCNVIPYRFDGSGILRPGETIRVSLIGRRARSDHRTFSAFYGQLLSAGRCFWQDVVRIAARHLEGVDDETLSEHLELLYADGSITIENYDEAPANWIIRAEI